MPNVDPYIYTTLAFLALLGAPYIYDISSLRVKLSVRNVAPIREAGVSVMLLLMTVGNKKNECYVRVVSHARELMSVN